MKILRDVKYRQCYAQILEIRRFPTLVTVYIWRYDSIWVGSARVISADAYGLEVFHNGNIETSSIHLIKLIGA